MIIKDDRNEFEKRQTKLIQEIASDVRSRLEEMGLGSDQELVENLVFDICAIFDGSRPMDLDGKSVRPFLTFANDDEGKELVATEGGSWMHEVCSEIVDEIFEGDEPAEND